MTDLICLRCVREGNKLRMKIVSKGYNPAANCQCPRPIRIEGHEYTVPRSDISLANTQGKFFYRINGKNIRPDLIKLKVYGDENPSECSICMVDANPAMTFVIFAPCGHYCSCMECAKKLQTCPLCRGPIAQLVTKDQLQ